MTYEASTSVISSPGSASGPLRPAPPAGQTLVASGPAVALANRSARRGRASALTTLAISGPTGFGSLRSAGLTRSLVSRLQRQVSGSILYELIWKVSALPSGVLIYRLRASPRARTSANVCSGWPTCTTPSGGQTWPPGTSATGRRPDGSKATVNLEQVARLAGWPTTTRMDGNGARNRTSGRSDPNSKHHDGLTMCDAVSLTGWATTRDFRSDRGVLTASELYGSKGQPLARQALYADATGCSVTTPASGLLRPGHSRWLLRIPPAWEYCAASAMLWTSKRRRAS